MILGIDHIGIAVAEIEAALAIYRDAIGLALESVEEIPSQKLRSFHLRIGASESRFELLIPTDSSSVIASFLQKRGAGIHHVALQVDGLAAERARLVAAGLEPIGEPSTGANGKTIQFFHPRSTGGVLLEICSGGGGGA